jgi:putative MFS transporter
MIETTTQDPLNTGNPPDPPATLSGKQVARVFDLAGVARGTKILVGAACLGYLFDGFDNFLLGFVMPYISRDFTFSPTMKGIILSTALWGGALGMWFWGIVAEQKGRRVAFQGTLLTFTIFCGLTAFAHSPLQLAIARFITGIGLAGFMPVDLLIVSEMTPTRVRGRLTSSTSLLMPFGTFFAASAVFVLAPHIGWRGMFLVGILPAFIAFVVRRYVPESPRWLASKGRIREAEAALIKMGATREQIATARKTVPYEDDTAKKLTDNRLKEKYKEIFSLQWLPRNIVAWSLWIVPNSIILGVSLWLPSYFMTVYHLSLTRSMAYTVANAAAGVIGRVISVCLIDKIGRRPLIITTFSAASLCLLGAVFVTNPAHLLYCLGTYTFFSDAGTVVAVTFVPELFPTRIRAIASSSAATASRITAATAPIMMGALIGLNLQKLVWLIFATALSICVVVTASLAPETKGITLEELDPTNRRQTAHAQ